VQLLVAKKPRGLNSSSYFVFRSVRWWCKIWNADGRD